MTTFVRLQLAMALLLLGAPLAHAQIIVPSTTGKAPDPAPAPAPTKSAPLAGAVGGAAEPALAGGHAAGHQRAKHHLGGAPGELTGPGKTPRFYMHDALVEYKVSQYLSATRTACTTTTASRARPASPPSR